MASGIDTGIYPPPGQPIVNPKDGRPTQSMGALISSIKQFLSPNPNPQPIYLTQFISGIIAIPAVKEYRIIEQLPVDILIDSFSTTLGAGATSVKLTVAGIDVTGSGINAVPGPRQTATIAAYPAPAGNSIRLQALSVASALDLSFVMVYRQQNGTT